MFLLIGQESIKLDSGKEAFLIGRSFEANNEVIVRQYQLVTPAQEKGKYFVVTAASSELAWNAFGAFFKKILLGFEITELGAN